MLPAHDTPVVTQRPEGHEPEDAWTDAEPPVGWRWPAPVHTPPHTLVADPETRALADGGDARTKGWIRPGDLKLAARLEPVRPRRDRGVLLSPFDPLLWDRTRVERLFGFHQVLEVFKPAAHRLYGYYRQPVLAGERLVARVDLKAETRSGRLRVVSCHFEDDNPERGAGGEVREAVRSALERYAGALALAVEGWKPG